MKIISHRGYWKNANEKNKSISFERSFSSGFGTETDLRDFNGKIVISHDVADDSSILLSQLFSIYKNSNSNFPLALNIKADGLQHMLKKSLLQYEIENYFVFDMSIPDTINYIGNGIKIFSRQSEYEREPAFYDKCCGIWLDAFNSTWYDLSVIKDHIRENKQVAIVSPELHNRDFMPFWELLKKEKVHLMDNIILCTDIPESANTFFN